MKIPEFDAFELTRTNPAHLGNSKIKPLTYKVFQEGAVQKVKSVDRSSEAVSLQRANKTEHKTFQDYLFEAVNTVNNNQLDVQSLQEKLITSPDEVDIHDVTVAMSKARMSLNLAQTVIDRIITDWNEITTTR